MKRKGWKFLQKMAKDQRASFVSGLVIALWNSWPYTFSMRKALSVVTAICSALAVVWLLITLFTQPSPLAKTNYFPLALHNSWTHLVTFSGDYLYYMTETVIKDDMPLLEEISYVVAEEYEPLTTASPEAKSTVAYFHKDGFLHRYPWLDSDGKKIWDTKLGEGSEQILPLPYLGKTTWQIGMQTNAWPLNGGQTMTASAKAWIDPEEVRVPAGVFQNCLRVETISANHYVDNNNESKGYRLHHIEWYADGVGLVRAISNEGEGTPIKSLTELVWYNVQP